MMEHVHKIAVVRVNALGDLLFALPALHSLRTAYPDAEIVLLARAWHRDFLAARPSPVDRVIVVPPVRGVGAPEDSDHDDKVLDRFFADMREEHFDVAVQLHGGGRFSNPFVRRLGAGLCVGLRADDAPPLDRWVPYIYFQPEVARYLDVVGLLGANTAVTDPWIAVTAADRTAAAAALEASARTADASRDTPLVVLHPGASDPRRRWPERRFAAVGDALARRGAQIVVTGTQEEASLVASVVAGMHAPARALCGVLELGGLAGLLERAALVVSNDSGPLHLASAVGTPTVGIYWIANLINSGPLSRLRHRPLVSWRMECPVCGAHCVRQGCTHSACFVDDVEVSDVQHAAEALLDLAHPPLVLVS